MSFFIGKISKRGNGSKVIRNELPEWVVEKDGKYYNKETGKELITKKVSFEEIFGEDMTDYNKYVKVTKEYDGTFKVGNFYKVYEELVNGITLYNEEGKIYHIPKECLESE